TLFHWTVRCWLAPDPLVWKRTLLSAAPATNRSSQNGATTASVGVVVRSAFVKLASAVPQLSNPLLLTNTVGLVAPWNGHEKPIGIATLASSWPVRPVMAVPVVLMSSNVVGTAAPE